MNIKKFILEAINNNFDYNKNCPVLFKVNDEVIKEINKFNTDEELLRAGGISTDTLDRLAFGFSSNDIKTLLPSQLNIKWKDDLANVLYEIKQSGLNKKQWASNINLSEPIDVSYEKNKFYIEDGHHRFVAAKILNKPLNVNLEIKQNPIISLGGKDYDMFHRCIFHQIKK